VIDYARMFGKLTIKCELLNASTWQLLNLSVGWDMKFKRRCLLQYFNLQEVIDTTIMWEMITKVLDLIIK